MNGVLERLIEDKRSLLDDSLYVQTVHHLVRTLSTGDRRLALQCIRRLAGLNSKRFLPYWGLVLSVDGLLKVRDDCLKDVLQMLLAMCSGIKSIILGTCKSPYAFQSTSSSTKHFAVLVEAFSAEALEAVGVDLETQYLSLKLCGILYSQLGTFLSIDDTEKRVRRVLALLDTRDLFPCAEKTLLSLLDAHTVTNLALFSPQFLATESGISKRIYSQYYRMLPTVPCFAWTDCAVSAAGCCDVDSFLHFCANVKDEQLVELFAQVDCSFVDLVLEEHHLRSLLGRLVLPDPLSEHHLTAVARFASCLSDSAATYYLEQPCASPLAKIKFIDRLLQVGKRVDFAHIERIMDAQPAAVDTLVLCIQAMRRVYESDHNKDVRSLLVTLLEHPEAKVVWNAAGCLCGLGVGLADCDRLLQMIAAQPNYKAKAALIDLLALSSPDCHKAISVLLTRESSQLESPTAPTPVNRVVLLGEHAVVRGKNAIVLAIDKRVVVEVVAAEGRGVWVRLQDLDYEGPVTIDDQVDARVKKSLLAIGQAIKQCHVDTDHRRVTITVRSDLPIGKGMGSSAAFATAVVAALMALTSGQCWDAQEVFREAWKVEQLIHGVSSGMDVAASVLGGVLSYSIGDGGRRLSRLGADCTAGHLLLIDSGVARETTNVNQHMQRLEAEQPEWCRRSFDEIDATVRGLLDGTLLLPEAIRRNQRELDQMGLMNDQLYKIQSIADRYGYPAKITGAGRGGCMLAYTVDDAFDAAFIKDLTDLATVKLRQVLCCTDGVCYEVCLLHGQHDHPDQHNHPDHPDMA